MSEEWIKTSEQLPTKVFLKEELGCDSENYNYVDCYIFVNGNIYERPFNIRHQCWDDQQYDDFEYEATEPSHWMICPPWPMPPKDA